jgi:hypothetical protein
MHYYCSVCEKGVQTSDPVGVWCDCGNQMVALTGGFISRHQNSMAA